MLILTNFQRFPETWRTTQGVTGRAVMLPPSAWDFLRHSPKADLVVINCDVSLAMKLAALYLLFPFLRRPILGHDIVLRKPSETSSKLAHAMKRFLLSRIDHFSLHFLILDGYRKYFGIRPERVSYLPSKPNIRYRYEYKVSPDGEYILCFGRSDRDYDTFFRAMEKLPDLPAVIPPPNFAAFQRHSARFTYDVNRLPSNVRIVEDDGSVQSLIRIVEKAKLVVLPTVASRIAPSGIGTYLNAMLMGKCVIASQGVATSDVLLNGEALLVPPEDADALADTIRRAWADKDLRERTAEAGRKYSEACGGEPELRQRVLDRAVEKLAAAPRRHPS
jgi:glycosyltransferase involved in cell wall biosynthesis